MPFVDSIPLTARTSLCPRLPMYVLEITVAAPEAFPSPVVV